MKIGRALTHTELDDPGVGEPARDEGILGMMPPLRGIFRPDTLAVGENRGRIEAIMAGTTRCPGGDSTSGRSHGDPQSDLGYTRIQGALKNLDHRVARSTVAKILREQGTPPSRQRPIMWHRFLRAHWRAFLAADFFTTEVWTAHGLVTYYTVFV